MLVVRRQLGTSGRLQPEIVEYHPTPLRAPQGDLVVAGTQQGGRKFDSHRLSLAGLPLPAQGIFAAARVQVAVEGLTVDGDAQARRVARARVAQINDEGALAGWPALAPA